MQRQSLNLYRQSRLLYSTTRNGETFLKAENCVSLIKQCKSLKPLKSVHASVLRSNLHLNLYFSTNLIAHYASLGSISYAYTLFSATSSSSSSLDVFIWNVMIRGFVDHGFYDRAISVFRQMLELGISPDNFTFPFVIKACGCVCDFDLGVELHRRVVECGYEKDVFVGNSLVAMYGKLGRTENAERVFEEMPEKNVVSWSSMIGAYVQNRFFKEGLSLFAKMVDEGIRPNRAAVLNSMACVCRENEADEVCRVVRENKLDLDRRVQNAAMQMYARCGRIDVARGVFDRISNKDLVSWSSMIEAYVQTDLPLAALELFKQMIVQRIYPDAVILLGVVHACSSLASFHQARFFHSLILRSYFRNQLELQTAVVDLYVKCGSLVYARKVFDKMQERNMISWSTMISGYGMHGHARDALKLFDQMKTLAKPDHVAFLSVLSACSHGGLITEGWECFNSMNRDFKVIPRPEHYACMVDLLGRAGQLNDAHDFIQTMPVKPDAGVWGALLGACRIHSNVELAEVASTHLFGLDADNPGRYVLMSNIYASCGKQKHADQIRDLMKRRGVKKIAGHTIIEIEDKTYTFVAGDKSYHQSDLIYSELEKLMDRIRLEGYKPDLNFVLHNVEEEMKEKILYVHSEKLAIVFGLMNSGSETIIRVKKNLRVCGDCHTAIKFISKVTGREIVMRDSHRFHHFMSGTCSCGDYW